MFYGPKLTTINVVAIYLSFFLLTIIKCLEVLSNRFQMNTIIEGAIGILSFIFVYIRFYGFKTIKDIEDKKNKMTIEKSKTIDMITISLMVIIPIFLMLLYNS